MKNYEIIKENLIVETKKQKSYYYKGQWRLSAFLVKSEFIIDMICEYYSDSITREINDKYYNKSNNTNGVRHGQDISAIRNWCNLVDKKNPEIKKLDKNVLRSFLIEYINECFQEKREFLLSTEKGTVFYNDWNEYYKSNRNEDKNKWTHLISFAENKFPNSNSSDVKITIKDLKTEYENQKTKPIRRDEIISTILRYNYSENVDNYLEEKNIKKDHLRNVFDVNRSAINKCHILEIKTIKDMYLNDLIDNDEAIKYAQDPENCLLLESDIHSFWDNGDIELLPSGFFENINLTDEEWRSLDIENKSVFSNNNIDFSKQKKYLEKRSQK